MSPRGRSRIKPLGPHCAFVGAEEAVEAANRSNRAFWKEYNRQAEKQTVIKPDGPPVNILGGYKFPGAPAVDLSRPKKSAEIIHPPITAEKIPAFLRQDAQ